MPPMSFVGVVTKAGFMNKTATVTVSRWVIDKRTGKVGGDQSNILLTALTYNLSQRISRDKKFLIHDERNRASGSTCCGRPPSSKTLLLILLFFLRTSRGRLGFDSELSSHLCAKTIYTGESRTQSGD